MKLAPEQLEENNYVLLEKLEHTLFVQFIKTTFQKTTLYSVIYYLSILTAFCLLLTCCFYYYHTKALNIPMELLYGFIGAIAVIAIIPIHETIHLLVYKLTGAKNTSFDFNLRKFVFLAVADKFVVNEREMKIVALAPFAFITSTLMAIFFFTLPEIKIAILSAIMVHSALCSGDFALASYFNIHRDKEVVTYDDKENKVSYFFAKDK
ncbi:DUF3267 domain-containing protein [Flavobacterium wongokense]|uniref:DUF3267 domain-containing protein n=1 Tax=Flavobacterium wongokense TaxID=2910674 RepID=UPI001F3E6BE1|nr:DUF3267 domain-containing protein [Flavobacterium sp. WG47]MCF6131872.1 DUF3267 domain-containing protein [Flavobacterium sp. WG47]